MVVKTPNKGASFDIHQSILCAHLAACQSHQDHNTAIVFETWQAHLPSWKIDGRMCCKCTLPGLKEAICHVVNTGLLRRKRLTTVAARKVVGVSFLFHKGSCPCLRTGPVTVALGNFCCEGLSSVCLLFK